MPAVLHLDYSIGEVGGGTESPDFPLSLAITESAGWKDYQIATGQTDQSLTFGHVATATCFVITSDQTITVKINGSATGQTVTANGAIIMFNTSVTSSNGITITNASGSTANVRYLLGGA